MFYYSCSANNAEDGYFSYIPISVIMDMEEEDDGKRMGRLGGGGGRREEKRRKMR